MSRGRHAAPPDHHVAHAVVGSTAAATLATGGFLAVTQTETTATRGTSISEVQPDTRPMQRVTEASTQAAATRYVVKSGDTLSQIGAGVGEPWQWVFVDNAGTIGPDPNRIRPGQTLLLDSGPPTEPIAVPTVTKAAPVASMGRHRAPVDGQDVADEAHTYLGVPYAWGGTSRAGMDCSGLVLRVFADLGVTQLPHSSLAQSHIGALVTGLANARPGDLLFFDNPVGHVGIYIGDGQMIAAPTFGQVVKVQSVYATPTVIRRLV